MFIGYHTCTSDLFALGINKIYHSIPIYALKLTYLYKLSDQTWKELNVSYHSDLYSKEDILVQVI
jgi:hypothetical protein